MKNCELTIECEGLDCVHCIHVTLVRENPNAAALLLATVGAFKRMSHGNSNSLTSVELSNIQKKQTTTLKNFRDSSSGCPDVTRL